MLKDVVQAKNAEALARAMEDAVFQARKKDWLPTLPRKDMTIRDYEDVRRTRKQRYDSMEKDFLLEIEDDTVTVDVAIAKICEVGADPDEVSSTTREESPMNSSILPRTRASTCSTRTSRKRDQRQDVRRLPASGHVAGADQGSGAIRPGLDQGRHEAGRSRRTEDALQHQSALPHHPPAMRRCQAIGHTLLAGPAEEDRCRSMIFFENSYSSADTGDQIEDRIHRRGQTGSMSYT